MKVLRFIENSVDFDTHLRTAQRKLELMSDLYALRRLFTTSTRHSACSSMQFKEKPWTFWKHLMMLPIGLAPILVCFPAPGLAEVSPDLSKS